MSFPHACAAGLLLALLASPALCLAKEGESAVLSGGYRIGDGVVALVDWESTIGSFAKGTVGTAQAAGHAPDTLACVFPGVSQAVELPLAQLGNRSKELNGGYRIGDHVASLIAWENNGNGISRGDIGMVLDSGRKEEGLMVSFPRMRRIVILLTQVGRVGMPLGGGYRLGDKVVSLIRWSGAAGNLTEGDVGVALASGNGGKGIVVDFPNVKNLNIMLHQIRKEGEATPEALPAAVSLGETQQDSAAPKAAQNKEVHEESNEQASAQVGREQMEQERRTEPAPTGGSAPAAAANASSLALTAASANATAAAGALSQVEADKDEKVVTKEHSSLRQKLAKAKRNGSLAKKLAQAKANRDSERDTAPTKRRLVQPDTWPADSKESLLNRLMGPLLGKKRASEDEVAALSLAQTDVTVVQRSSKKPLLSAGAKKKHEDL